jgi:hypothetical protein
MRWNQWKNALFFSQYAGDFVTKTSVARTFVVDTMEDGFSLPIQDELISLTNNLSYHSIQDGVDQSKPNFCFEENSKVSPFHVIFCLMGVFTRQGRSFEAFSLITREWYKCPSFDSLVILQPRLVLQESYKSAFISL